MSCAIHTVVLIDLPGIVATGLTSIFRSYDLETIEILGEEVVITRPRGTAVVTELGDGTRIQRLYADAQPAVVVAVVPEESPAAFALALASGAHAVVGMASTPEMVRASIESACHGRTIIPTEVATAMASHYPPPLSSRLGQREIEWLRMLAGGSSIETIALEVGYSPRHFKRMLKDTYDKLGVANRTQALIRAMQLGLMDDD